MSDDPHDSMRIGELAEQAGVTVRTIRYYVAEGLLPPPSGGGKYRTYAREHLLALRAIRRLKEAYLPLAEIRRRLQATSSADLQRLGRAPCSSPWAETQEPRRVPPLALPSPGTAAKPGDACGPTTSAPAKTLQRMAQGTGSVVAGHTVPTQQLRQAVGESASTVWRRVVLAPGVELHYQVAGDRRRYEVIGRLIRLAARLFDDDAPSNDPRPHSDSR